MVAGCAGGLFGGPRRVFSTSAFPGYRGTSVLILSEVALASGQRRPRRHMWAGAELWIRCSGRTGEGEARKAEPWGVGGGAGARGSPAWAGLRPHSSQPRNTWGAVPFVSRREACLCLVPGEGSPKGLLGLPSQEIRSWPRAAFAGSRAPLPPGLCAHSVHVGWVHNLTVLPYPWSHTTSDEVLLLLSLV